MARRNFDETGYPCESAPARTGSIHEEAWVYTQAEGLVICGDGCTHCGRQKKAITISWGQIKRALNDYKNAPARARRVKYGRGVP